MPTDLDSIIIEQQEQIRGLLLQKLSRKAKTREEFQKLAQKYGYHPKEPSRLGGWLEKEVLIPARGVSLRHISEHFRRKPKARPMIDIPKEELTELISEVSPAETATTRIARAMARPEPTMRAGEEPAFKPSIFRASKETEAGLLESNLQSLLTLFKFPVTAGLEVEKTLKPLGKKGIAKYIPKPTTQTGKWFKEMAKGIGLAPVELMSTLYQLSQPKIDIHVLGRGVVSREQISREILQTLPEQAVKVMIGRGMLKGVGKITKGLRMGWKPKLSLKERLAQIEKMEIPPARKKPVTEKPSFRKFVEERGYEWSKMKQSHPDYPALLKEYQHIPGKFVEKPIKKKPTIRERLRQIEEMEIPPAKKPLKSEIPQTPQNISLQTVMQALKEVRPLREMQRVLYKGERGTRLGRAITAGGAVKGMARHYARLGQMKGEYSKVQFESLRSKIPDWEKHLDNIVDIVYDSPMLTEWEKFPAGQGLAKLFGEAGGRVPTMGELALLDRVFPSEFIDVLMQKRPLWKKFKEGGLQLANIPRAVMASFDLSFGGRQGAFAAPSFRTQFFDAWKRQFKIFGSEKAYRASQEALAAHPDFQLARKSRVSFTELGRIMRQREEPFASQWAERIPVVGKGIRMSGRAYTAFANKFRMDMFSRMIKDAEAQGLKPRENAYLANRIADFVNTATGRGSIGSFEGAALALNAVFFSPRLMASRLKILISPIYYLKEPAFVRRQALKSLLAAGGTAATVMALAKLGGAEVGLDPRSADFGKIKIGNTRVDVLAGFGQYIRPVGQIATGLHISSVTGREITLGEGYKPLTAWDILLRSIESKEAPLASLFTELMKGRDYQGRRLEIPRAVGNRFVPMVMGDMVDIYKENPKLLPLSILAVFGMGMQTYPSYPVAEITVPEGTFDWERFSKLTGVKDKQDRILENMQETFIESGLELEDFRRIKDFNKTLIDLETLHKKHWNDEMGSVLTTYMLNRFNKPATVKRWVAEKLRKATADEDRLFWSTLLKNEVVTWELYKAWKALPKSVKLHTPETIKREGE